MKRNFWLFVIVILSCLTLIQCRKKCNSQLLGEIRLTQTDMKINPYTGTERIIFKDSVGDSLCYGSGFRSSYSTYIYDPSYKSDIDGYCSGDYYIIERNATYFTEDNYGAISVDITIEDPFKENKKNIIFGVSYKDSQKWYFYCDFIIDSIKLYVNPKPVYGSARILSYNDSIIIGPNKYYSVYSLSLYNDTDPQTHIQDVYYSLKNGIVGFKNNEGHLWFLSN
jgi:hypothetical protein